MNLMAEDESTQAPAIHCLGENNQENDAIRRAWRTFDASVCECFNDADKQRILAVIERYPGGVSAFSKHVQGLAEGLFEAEAAATLAWEVYSDEVNSVYT